VTAAHNLDVPVVPQTGEILIAGVPWPTYKVVALAVGLVVLLVIGVATMSPAAAVLSAAGAASLVWLTLGLTQTSHSDR
jgi:hypothetical protein